MWYVCTDQENVPVLFLKCQYSVKNTENSTVEYCLSKLKTARFAGCPAPIVNSVNNAVNVKLWSEHIVRLVSDRSLHSLYNLSSILIPLVRLYQTFMTWFILQFVSRHQPFLRNVVSCSFTRKKTAGMVGFEATTNDVLLTTLCNSLFHIVLLCCGISAFVPGMSLPSVIHISPCHSSAFLVSFVFFSDSLYWPYCFCEDIT